MVFADPPPPPTKHTNHYTPPKNQNNQLLHMGRYTSLKEALIRKHLRMSVAQFNAKRLDKLQTNTVAW